MLGSEGEFSLAAVPLFPLPHVVLFPRAILPLHIFEERYRAMTEDALAGDRLIAMALMHEGWEKCWKPAIEPVVCVGQILTSERLDDGNYNLLLQGRLRARLVREIPGQLYRVGQFQPLEEQPALEIDLEEARTRLAEVFSGSRAGNLPIARQFRQLLSSTLPTADIADLAAFLLLDDVPHKQHLLAETHVRRRVEEIADAVKLWGTHINTALLGLPVDPGLN